MVPFDEVNVPPSVRYLWDFFWLTERYRTPLEGRGGFIPATEIKALSEGYGWRLSGWEWDALLNMDAARRSALLKPNRFDRPLPLTPEAFDLMFD